MKQTTKQTIILDPHPRTLELLFSKERMKRLRSMAKIHSHEGERMPDSMVDQLIGEASAIVGQTNLPKERLERAKNLRAVVNVEGNFLQNIDYGYCFEHGIHVLGGGAAFAPAVAEMVVGFALSLARRIPEHDKLFRDGREVYGGKSNSSSFLLRGKRVGLIGYGNLGHAVVPLLRPFGCTISVYDPWLPDSYLMEQGLRPAGIHEILKESKVIFLLAGATSENRAMLGRSELNLIAEGSAFVLASRASLVDFDALTQHLKTGHFSAAIDVFPEEPLPADHPIRTLPNVLLSAHRAGGISESYELMGEMVVDDLSLILRGLAPVRLQKATRETVGKMQSKPVG